MIEKLITIGYGILAFILFIGFIITIYKNIKDGLNND